MATADVLDQYLVATVDTSVLEGWAEDEFGLAGSAPPNVQPYPALVLYDHANAGFYHRHGWCVLRVRVGACGCSVCLCHRRPTPRESLCAARPQLRVGGAANGHVERRLLLRLVARVIHLEVDI